MNRGRFGRIGRIYFKIINNNNNKFENKKIKFENEIK